MLRVGYWDLRERKSLEDGETYIGQCVASKYAPILQIKEDGMGEICNTHGRDERCLNSRIRKVGRVETI